MAKVVLEGIGKTYGEDVEAVKDINMEFEDRKLIALLGPSGCGKTTLMRLIAGLIAPTTGRIYFDDRDVTKVPTERRNIAMVFQFPVAYETMSVYENLAFPLKSMKVPESEIKSKVKDIAEFLGITDILSENPRKFSAAVKQLVALGRALVRDPEVFLLDEPLTNIDPKSRAELRAKIKETRKMLPHTMIYVTHDQAESLTLADKIGIMKAGTLLQYDTPEEVYLRPRSTFTAYFIGNPGMNLIDATYSKSDGKASLDAGEFTYDVTDLADSLDKQSHDNELILGIRPEHSEVYSTGRPDLIPGKCALIEMLGSVMVLHLEIGNLNFIAKTKPQKISVGDKVWVGLPRDKIRIFSKGTGELLS